MTDQEPSDQRDGFHIRPMTIDDAAALRAFASELQAADLLFLPRDIRQPHVIDAWVREMEDGRLASILAISDDLVIGCGTVVRDERSWSPHVAEIRVVLSSSMRGKGFGIRLIQQTFRSALESGAEKIIARMTTDQASAITSFEGLGFTPEAILRDHVKDDSGATHDLVILSHRVADVARRMEAYGLGVD